MSSVGLGRSAPVAFSSFAVVGALVGFGVIKSAKRIAAFKSPLTVPEFEDHRTSIAGSTGRPSLRSSNTSGPQVSSNRVFSSACTESTSCTGLERASIQMLGSEHSPSDKVILINASISLKACPMKSWVSENAWTRAANQITDAACYLEFVDYDLPSQSALLRKTLSFIAILEMTEVEARA